MLGVLGSAGAAICLAPSRLTEEWNAGQAINAVTGTRLWGFVFSLPGTILILVLPFVFMRLRPRWLGCRCTTVGIPPRSPTGDATAPPAFSRRVAAGLVAAGYDSFFRYQGPSGVASAGQHGTNRSCWFRLHLQSRPYGCFRRCSLSRRVSRQDRGLCCQCS